jgi:hypothetical protein
MSKNKSKRNLFDFNFPDGFPTDIARIAAPAYSNLDDLCMAAFEYFDELDEKREHDIFKLPVSLDETESDGVPSLRDIRHDHLRAVDKFRRLQELGQKLNERLLHEKAFFRTGKPGQLSKDHSLTMSKLRADAILEYNSLLKNLEFIEFCGRNFRDHACRLSDDLATAKAAWKRQARHEFNHILKKTASVECGQIVLSQQPVSAS